MTEYLQKLRKKFLNEPDSASSNGWKKWEEENKSEHPVRFFLLDTVPDFISFNWRWWIKDPIYHFKCKYIVKHHHIKIDVNRFMNYDKPSFRNYGWIDSDEQILHAMFQILVDFIEQEADIIDWAADAKHQKIYNELRLLYDWWIKSRPDRDSSYPHTDDFGFDNIFGDNARKHPGYKSWRDACEKKEERDREYELEDTEMLIRLITIRQYMWT